MGHPSFTMNNQSAGLLSWELAEPSLTYCFPCYSDAVVLGFQLFCVFVNAFGPSKNFEPFVKGFLQKQIHGKFDDVAVMAKCEWPIVTDKLNDGSLTIEWHRLHWQAGDARCQGHESQSSDNRRDRACLCEHLLHGEIDIIPEPMLMTCLSLRPGRRILPLGLRRVSRSYYGVAETLVPIIASSCHFAVSCGWDLGSGRDAKRRHIPCPRRRK